MRVLASAVLGLFIACVVGCASASDVSEAAPTVERFVRAVAALDEQALDEALAQPRGGDARLWADVLLGRSSGCAIDSIEVGEPSGVGEPRLEYLVLVTSSDLEDGQTYIAVVVVPQGSRWVIDGATGMGSGDEAR